MILPFPLFSSPGEEHHDQVTAPNQVEALAEENSMDQQSIRRLPARR
jgi:hypothetical protein